MRGGGGIRLALFATALAVVAGAAALLGRASDVVAAEPAPAPEGHVEEESAATAPANGLSDVGGGVRLVLAPTTLEAGRATRVTLRLVGEDGEPLTELDEHDGEPPLHLIVVSRDVSEYLHLHPRRAGDGFEAELTLPAPGVWRAYADFELDGEKIVLGRDLVVPGVLAPRPPHAPAAVATAGGYRAELDADDLTAGGDARLAFELTRAGERVVPEPYLGADGHLVAIREDDLAYLHVHPVEGSAAGTVAFDAGFADAGRYALFLQFRHGGAVRTVRFAVEVAR